MKKVYAFITLVLLFAVFSFFQTKDEAVANRSRQYYEQAGQVVWDIHTDQKVLALTFDDGPHKAYTPEILELLALYEAKATFFIIGENAKKDSALVERINEEGHEIANHTYTHPLKTTVPKLIKEIEETSELLEQITGSRPKLFRPVGGQYTDAMIDAITEAGYKVVMWSWHLDTEDWKEPGVEKIIATVNSAKEGDVILFHDGGGNRQQTVEALKQVLPQLKEQGYTFVTISELLAIQQSTIQK
ncbi:polysaccharide deacetylase family protein [Metasolibacillus meyeri]|uniref:Polysaccharide deacetylase family protein n=1 Tax=Metasolibacillus meyeri TaxID=1071052 RepID=A0AAW9NS18_9BACL|nr:polysaccharide deacetylase family protein [Metasolibacillus meyeri]MEC1179142.1 polysaccharide deacetylase family protein [Metasolibacillus meyeri]